MWTIPLVIREEGILNRFDPDLQSELLCFRVHLFNAESMTVWSGGVIQLIPAHSKNTVQADQFTTSGTEAGATEVGASGPTSEVRCNTGHFEPGRACPCTLATRINRLPESSPTAVSL